ncbi:MAG: V-type ATPase 116kDa subunit family protein [Lachnospiraceae bacterium]|nr:V-type ATPase 116kDa subunit family protein [Lachnospiraceae bacterium]
MIVKMKFVSLTGPKDDIDRMVDKYLSKYDIHLENAMSELSQVQDLRPYVQENPYRKRLAKANAYSAMVGKATPVPAGSMTIEESMELVRSLDENLTVLSEQKAELAREQEKCDEMMDRMRPYVDIMDDIDDILGFEFIGYRFGRFPKMYLNRFKEYMYDNFCTILQECGEDDEYVYCVYFAPHTELHRIEAVYSSMHFERLYIPDEYRSDPAEAFKRLSEKKADIDEEIADIEGAMKKILIQRAPSLLGAKEKLESLSRNFDVRKMAALTENEREQFYILCGWMAEEDLAELKRETADDEKVVLMVQDNDGEVRSSPPTKLKNPGLVKPYEMYVKMYGLPNYREMDPTALVAITYSLLFGVMYGDVGQGLCLMIGGFLLYRFRHSNLAGIISLAGVFSTIFGFLYGSIFGFEDILEPLWLDPRHDMTTLPGVGSINTILVCAVVFGMFLTIVTMVLHIRNYLRDRNTEEAFFSTNSVAGLIFYATVAFEIIMIFSGHAVPAAKVFEVIIILSVLVMFFKEPLSKIVERKASAGKAARKTRGSSSGSRANAAPEEEGFFPGGIGMFVVQGFFELFEVMLSYFSNTLSFVRVGAFAVSHAAMMSVVLQLAGAENGGNPNWIIVVFGNLFVMGIEGLIVGIQVLRLEFYELFSRYYKGNGKEFVSTFEKLENS